MEITYFTHLVLRARRSLRKTRTAQEPIRTRVVSLPYNEFSCAHCIALHHITSHHITSHSITLHLSTLHYITLHYVYIASHHITSHHIASHYITLRYIALYYIAYFVLHCSTSHSTPGYITASIVLIVSRSYQNFGEDVKTKIALGTKANWLGRSTLYYIYFQRE